MKTWKLIFQNLGEKVRQHTKTYKDFAFNINQGK